MPIAIDEASRCMKCGFCMSSCPVYGIDHIESHVARGRNVLIQLADKEGLAAEDTLRDALNYCMLCGRCESVCPAKVPSPSIAIQARARLVEQAGLSMFQRLVFRGILKHRPLMARLLGVAARVPGLSDKEGKPLRHLAEFASIFARGLLLPRISSPFLSERIPLRTLPPKGTPAHGEVAIYPGCAYEFFFAGIGKDMVTALAEAGYEVVYSPNLACCGPAVQSAGDLETARFLAKSNIEALAGFDRVITGCASCSSTLKKYNHLFQSHDPLSAKAKALAPRVHDFSEFLANKDYAARPAAPITITYHDPCHLKWHQGISADPRKILNSIKGVTLVEMEGADKCCGLGGSFGLTHRETSLELQAQKMAAIKKTNAQAVVTSCPGCQIQLMDGVRRHGLQVRVLHISQLMQGDLDVFR